MRSFATSSDSHNYTRGRRSRRNDEDKENPLMTVGALPLLLLHDPNGWEECCCWPHLSQSRAEETLPTLRDAGTSPHMIPIPSSNKQDMIHPFFNINHGATCSVANEYAFRADSREQMNHESQIQMGFGTQWRWAIRPSSSNAVHNIVVNMSYHVFFLNMLAPLPFRR